MALPSTYPLRPGQYFLWNSEYAQTQDLQHTMTRVLVTGIDRRGEEAHVCFAVQGEAILLTHCSYDNFLRSCSLDSAPCWVPAEEVASALAYTAQAMREAPTPGEYSFSPDRRAGVLLASQATLSSEGA